MEENSNKKGTIIRVILALAAVINDGFVISGIASFENAELTKWYGIVSFVLTIVVMFINTYYNNDFTPEGAAGTALTRNLKEIKKEFIFEDEDTEVDDE